MEFEEALRLRLISDPVVAAIQSARTTWGARPQGGMLPATVLNIVYDPVPTDFDGTVMFRPTLVQIDIYATLPSTVSRLASAVIAALLPPAVVGGRQFRRAFVEANRDAGEGGVNDFIHRRIVEMTFWHSTV